MISLVYSKSPVLKPLVPAIFNQTVQLSLVVFSRKPITIRPVYESSGEQSAAQSDVMIIQKGDPVRDIVFWEKKGFKTETYYIAKKYLETDFNYDYFLLFPEYSQEHLEKLKKVHRFRDYAVSKFQN